MLREKAPVTYSIVHFSFYTFEITEILYCEWILSSNIQYSKLRFLCKFEITAFLYRESEASIKIE
jgi:hypothetical protein